MSRKNLAALARGCFGFVATFCGTVLAVIHFVLIPKHAADALEVIAPFVNKIESFSNRQIVVAILVFWLIALGLIISGFRESIPFDEKDGLVPIFDAGRWLYNHASEKVRTDMRKMVPSSYKSLAQEGAHFFIVAAQKGVGQLYGRRETGLRRERVTGGEAETDRFDPVYGDGDRSGHPTDLAIRRSDLRRVLKWYETD